MVEEEREEEEREEDGVERRERVGKGWRGLRGVGRERIRNTSYTWLEVHARSVGVLPVPHTRAVKRETRTRQKRGREKRRRRERW